MPRTLAVARSYFVWSRSWWVRDARALRGSTCLLRATVSSSLFDTWARARRPVAVSEGTGTVLAVAEPTPAPTPTHCAVCGLALGLQYWIADYPRAVHHGCRDWSTAPWPFAHVAAAIRRALRTRTASNPMACRRLLRELGDARRRWPRGDPRATYDALEPRCRAAMMAIGRR
jgi:hypothetical protein